MRQPGHRGQPDAGPRAAAAAAVGGADAHRRHAAAGAVSACRCTTPPAACARCPAASASWWRWPGRWPRRRGCCCWTSRRRPWACRCRPRSRSLIVPAAGPGTGSCWPATTSTMMFRLADRIVVLRHGRVAAEVDAGRGPPGRRGRAAVRARTLDSSARASSPGCTAWPTGWCRPIRRPACRSSCPRWARRWAASGCASTCAPTTSWSARPPSACRPSCWRPGPGCRSARRAARSAWPRRPRRRSSTTTPGPALSWAPFADLARTAKVAASWSVPVFGPGGLLGVITVLRSIAGPAEARRPGPGHPVRRATRRAAIERDRLLDEVTTRNRVLETIREMLETLAGPLPVADGLTRGAASRCATASRRPRWPW